MLINKMGDAIVVLMLCIIYFLYAIFSAIKSVSGLCFILVNDLLNKKLDYNSSYMSIK